MRTKTITIDPDVRDMLGRMSWFGNVARMPQMDRKLYERVNKVLELAGGKWNRGSKGHIFDENGQDRLAQALEIGEILDEKKTFQFFETPAHLADRMVEILSPQLTEFVLEPSCGKGSLIAALLRVGVKKEFTWGVELNANYARECQEQTGVAPRIGDFMCYSPPCKFEKILMNPPFAGGQDVEHVTRAFVSMLEPGGRLVAITAPSWTFRTQQKFVAFQKLVNEHGYSEEIPAGTFTESGTDIRTRLVVLNKGE